MNENPGGMPNPLNPRPARSPRPSSSPLDANPADSTPLEEIVEEVQTVNMSPTGNATATNVIVQGVDPMARPMEQAPAATPEKPKKKKTGLIIGIIVAVVLAIGGGIAAAIILINMNRGDAVAKAVEKIMTGDAPSVVAVDGAITLAPNDEDSPISNVQIALDSQASTTSLLNSSVATVTANFASGDSASFEFDEIYAANGDLYFRLSGLTNAVEDYTKALTNALSGAGDVDCTVDENGETVCNEEPEVVDCASEGEEGCVSDVVVVEGDGLAVESDSLMDSMAEMLSVVEGVDGEWLRVSTDDLSGMVDFSQTQSNASCLIDMIGEAKNHSNSIAEMYGKNPFINSTTEGVTVTSKSGEPVYKVTIDNENFSKFIKEFQQSTLVNNLFTCMGYENTEVNVDNLVEAIYNLPTFYVEIDKDYNFTRLYLVSDLGDGEMSVTVDLGFSYPVNLNVAEPTEYKDFSETIQEIFTSMYVLPGAEEEVVESVEVVE